MILSIIIDFNLIYYDDKKTIQKKKNLQSVIFFVNRYSITI